MHIYVYIYIYIYIFIRLASWSHLGWWCLFMNACSLLPGYNMLMHYMYYM